MRGNSVGRGKDNFRWRSGNCNGVVQGEDNGVKSRLCSDCYVSSLALKLVKTEVRGLDISEN